MRHDPSPFNFAALNNAAARQSDADVLVFLNNDTEILDPELGRDLLEEALRPEVGAVAPLLSTPTARSSTPARRSACTVTPAIRSPDWTPDARRRSGAPTAGPATGWR